jgi:hypothetical protein
MLLYADTVLRDKPKGTFSEELTSQLNLLRLNQER